MKNRHFLLLRTKSNPLQFYAFLIERNSTQTQASIGLPKSLHDDDNISTAYIMQESGL